MRNKKEWYLNLYGIFMISRITTKKKYIIDKFLFLIKIEILIKNYNITLTYV